MSQDQFQRHAPSKLWTSSQAQFLQHGAMFGSGALIPELGTVKELLKYQESRPISLSHYVRMKTTQLGAS